MGTHVVYAGSGLDKAQRRRIDLEIDMDYGGDLAIGSMGVVGDIGMGRLMGNEADIVPPGMGVGAYRKPRAPGWRIPSLAQAAVGLLYNKRPFQYHREKTTAEIVRQLRPLVRRQVAENMLEEELAIDDEIVGVMEDLHAPGLERGELGSLIDLVERLLGRDRCSWRQIG